MCLLIKLIYKPSGWSISSCEKKFAWAERLCKCSEHSGAPGYLQHHERVHPSQSPRQLWATVTSKAAKSTTSSVHRDAKPEGRLSSEIWDTTATSVFRHTNLQASLKHWKCILTILKKIVTRVIVFFSSILSTTSFLTSIAKINQMFWNTWVENRLTLKRFGSVQLMEASVNSTFPTLKFPVTVMHLL